jgi:hypothetical protein
MQDENEMKSTFLNRRDWGSYLSALEDAANYPKLLEAKFLEALKSGRDWVSQGASEASSWLVGKGEIRDKLSAG